MKFFHRSPESVRPRTPPPGSSAAFVFDSIDLSPERSMDADPAA